MYMQSVQGKEKQCVHTIKERKLIKTLSRDYKRILKRYIVFK